MNRAIPSLVTSLSGMKSAIYPTLESTMKITTRIDIRIRSFFSPILDVGKALTAFALAILLALSYDNEMIYKACDTKKEKLYSMVQKKLQLLNINVSISKYFSGLTRIN
jgi:hypothetical protein